MVILTSINDHIFSVIGIRPSEVKMNRKKKINDTLKKRQKKANAKLQKSNKPRYISKAEREKLALAEQALKDSQAN